MDEKKKNGEAEAQGHLSSLPEVMQINKSDPRADHVRVALKAKWA